LATIKGVNQNTIQQVMTIVESASEFLAVAGVNTKKPISTKGCFCKLF
jgi:hypothetical protein